MKKQLTIEQVNENLEKYFPGKNGICISADESGYTDFLFIIEFRNEKFIKIAIDSKKQIWIMADSKAMADYNVYCHDFKKMMTQKQIGQSIYIPFSKDIDENKNHYSDLLVCTGYKKEKTNDGSDIAFLQKEAGSTFVKIYRMIFQLEIIRSYVTQKITNNGPVHLLTVIHSRGQFSFPIKGLSYDQDVERRIREIFYRALKMPIIIHALKAA